jgi:small subunit ribosomal protein S19
MVKKEFSYKGKSLMELRKLSLDELALLLPSRARRSIKHGFSDEKKILLKKLQTKSTVKTHLRSMLVLPSMVGKTIKVHNGKEFVPIIITEEMIGGFLGEFAMTRRKVQHNAPGIGATKSSSGAAVK